MRITIETLVHRGTAKYSAIGFIEHVGAESNIIVPELNKNMNKKAHVLHIILKGNSIVLL